MERILRMDLIREAAFVNNKVVAFQKVERFYFNEGGQLQKLSQNRWESRFGINYLQTSAPSSPAIGVLVQAATLATSVDIDQEYLSTQFGEQISQDYIAPTYVKQTPDMGLGLFARKNIKGDSLIGEYSGIVSHRRKVDKHNAYLFDIHPHDHACRDQFECPLYTYLIDAKYAGNETRFINHSDENPNITPHMYHDGEKIRIIFVSNSLIRKDEQLFYNYGRLFWIAEKIKNA
jgi:hypothetical protein